MGALHEVRGFRYFGPQDTSLGGRLDFRFFVSVDGVDWGEAAVRGSLESITGERAAAPGSGPSQRASPAKATSAAREARARRAVAV